MQANEFTNCIPQLSSAACQERSVALQMWSLYTETGTSAYDKGRYRLAHQMFHQAFKVASELSDQPLCLAASRYNLALIYRHQRRYRKATTFLKRALTLLEAESELHGVHIGRILDLLAEASAALGNFSKARTCYERAQSLEEKALGKNHPRLTQRLIKIAILHIRQNEHDVAYALYWHVLKMRAEATFTTPETGHSTV